jgi:hypothetical protein
MSAAPLLVQAALALCTGAARESKRCRRQREFYDEATLPLPNLPADFDNFTDLEIVLAHQYGPAFKGLPKLNVTYIIRGENGGSGADLPLRGAGTRIDNGRATFLATQPRIEWDCSGCTATVLFIDTDCGGRRAEAPQRLGWCGPVMHSLWSECSGGNLDSCGTTRVRYKPPGVRRGTNRYAFILLRQAKSLTTTLARRSLPVRSTMHWDLARFVAANRLEPIAWNFAHITGSGVPASVVASEPRQLQSQSAPGSRQQSPAVGRR